MDRCATAHSDLHLTAPTGDHPGILGPHRPRARSRHLQVDLAVVDHTTERPSSTSLLDYESPPRPDAGPESNDPLPPGHSSSGRVRDQATRIVGSPPSRTTRWLAYSGSPIP